MKKNKDETFQESVIKQGNYFVLFHSILNKRWKDKSDLIGQLEQQVHQMKDTWEAKEKKLMKERDEAVDRAR